MPLYDLYGLQKIPGKGVHLKLIKEIILYCEKTFNAAPLQVFHRMKMNTFCLVNRVCVGVCVYMKTASGGRGDHNEFFKVNLRS